MVRTGNAAFLAMMMRPQISAATKNDGRQLSTTNTATTSVSTSHRFSFNLSNNSRKERALHCKLRQNSGSSFDGKCTEKWRRARNENEEHKLMAEMKRQIEQRRMSAVTESDREVEETLDSLEER